jgi:hypothetical protein
MTGSISLLSPLRFVVAKPSRWAAKPSHNLAGATRFNGRRGLRLLLEAAQQIRVGHEIFGNAFIPTSGRRQGSLLICVYSETTSLSVAFSAN